jgi:hypothetical protein
VKKLMSQMKQRFPDDIEYAISLDQTLPVTEGLKEILKTLVIALVLVILVVFVFLQGWRATLIPLLAVPVSLVGTFIFSRCLASPSTSCRCSGWCWLSVWWWTMPLLSSMACSVTSKKASVLPTQLEQRWTSCRDR